MNGFNFVLTHHMIPYVRMTRYGKYVSPRAQRYLASQAQLKEQMVAKVKELASKGQTLYSDMINARVDGKDIQVEIMVPIPPKEPFNLELNFFFHPDKAMHYCDLDNLVKAIMDAGNKVLFTDDRWCDGFVANRIQLDEARSSNKHEILVEVEFTWL